MALISAAFATGVASASGASTGGSDPAGDPSTNSNPLLYTIGFTNLSQAYDGTAKTPTVTTAPVGLPVTLTYNQSTNAPISPGTYVVVATVVTTITNTLTISPASATVQLGNLAQTYDGTPKAPTVTTTPAGLPVSLTYNQSANPPTSAGNYVVIATVTSPNYTGSATNTLTISPANAAVLFANLTQTYDGTPKTPTVTTTPAGLPVALSYNQSATAPTNAGNYVVIATVTSPNYTGSATNSLTISPATAAVLFANLAQAYDGTPKTPTVTTTPAGLPVTLTFNQSASVPTSPGTYTVVATIVSPNFTGSATKTFTISSPSATIALNNLTQTYSGAPESPTVTTTPPGLPVTLTFNKSTTPPTVPGTYAVVATIVSPNYTGSTANTFTILPAAATVLLNYLAQAYDGTPKTPTVSTTPAGLPVTFTYNHGTNAPIYPGTYVVVATVASPDYAGSTTNTLVIMSSSPASINAASPSYPDVAAAVAAAKPGDTVHVPAGAAVWTQVLLITNGITLVGAGPDATCITNSIPTVTPWSLNERPPLVWIRITNDAPVRISGFYFFCNWTNGGQGVLSDPINLRGNPIMHSFRVDHCLFEQAKSRALELLGSVYGVIDHCLFWNCELTTEPCAGEGLEWSRFTAPYFGLGSTNTIVVEDCTVLYDNDGKSIGLSPAPAACGEGGHYVWRYNLITNAATHTVDGLDLHGNNFYDGYDPDYTNTPQPGWRGSIWFECYSNTFMLSNHSMRAMNLRGGTCMVYGNQFFGVADSCRIFLDEEESWLTNHFSPLRQAWPAQDQIINSFFWGNSRNGVATNDVRINLPPQSYTPGVTNPVAVFIQEGRDYWRRPPQATDAVANYVPLVHPHPLVTSQPTF